MGFAQEAKASYTNRFDPENVRQIVLPDAGGAAIAGSGVSPLYGAWTDVVLLAAVLQDTLIVSISIDTPSVLEIYDIDIGSCLGYANAAAVTAAGAGPIAAASRALVRFEVLTVAGSYAPIVLPFPVWIPAGVGIIARTRTVSGADTINVTCQCAQLFS